MLNLNSISEMLNCIPVDTSLTSQGVEVRVWPNLSGSHRYRYQETKIDLINP